MLQCILAMEYSCQKMLEFLNSKWVKQQYDPLNMDKDEWDV